MSVNEEEKLSDQEEIQIIVNELVLIVIIGVIFICMFIFADPLLYFLGYPLFMTIMWILGILIIVLISFVFT